MKTLLLVLTIGIYGCDAQVNIPKKQAAEVKYQSEPDFNVALKFVNDYVKYVFSKDKNRPSQRKWVKLNTLLTPNYKAKYQAFADSSTSEFGLDFNPILDAQDVPEKGLLYQKLTFPKVM